MPGKEQDLAFHSCHIGKTHGGAWDFTYSLRAKDNTFNAHMQSRLESNLPKVELVQHYIGRVVLNLINKALQACTERSHASRNGYRPEVIVAT